MSFSLLPLPFAADSLEPMMSQDTINFHYGKHHRSYVETLSGLVGEEAGLKGATLVDVVRAAHATKQRALFNNAAQTWNHNFFWQSLTPSFAEPDGRLAELIEREFGSTAALCDALRQEAVSHFSNGWVWLMLEDERLAVRSFHDADTPIVHDGARPLLVIDVWEHAYYIDYRNDRGEYADTLARCLNWAFAALNLDGLGVGRADQPQH